MPNVGNSRRHLPARPTWRSPIGVIFRHAQRGEVPLASPPDRARHGPTSASDPTVGNVSQHALRGEFPPASFDTPNMGNSHWHHSTCPTRDREAVQAGARVDHVGISYSDLTPQHLHLSLRAPPRHREHPVDPLLLHPATTRVRRTGGCRTGPRWPPRKAYGIPHDAGNRYEHMKPLNTKPLKHTKPAEILVIGFLVSRLSSEASVLASLCLESACEFSRVILNQQDR